MSEVCFTTLTGSDRQVLFVLTIAVVIVVVVPADAPGRILFGAFLGGAGPLFDSLRKEPNLLTGERFVL